MPVSGQTPTRIHLIDSERLKWEVIGSAYPDPNDPTKLVRDVKGNPTIGEVDPRQSTSETIGQTSMGKSVTFDDSSPSAPIAVSLDSSVIDTFMCFVLNESTQTVTLTPTSGDINDGSGAASSKTMAAGTSCTLYKTSIGSPSTAHWKMHRGAVSGSSPNFADNETVSGSGTSWTLANDPNPDASLILVQILPSFGGVVLIAGTHYTLSGTSITTTNSISSGALRAWYRY